MACLRTTVKLLDDLDSILPDGSIGDSGHIASRQFLRHSNFLLQGLELCQSDIPVSFASV